MMYNNSFFYRNHKQSQLLYPFLFLFPNRLIRINGTASDNRSHKHMALYKVPYYIPRMTFIVLLKSNSWRGRMKTRRMDNCSEIIIPRNILKCNIRMGHDQSGLIPPFVRVCFLLSLMIFSWTSWRRRGTINKIRIQEMEPIRSHRKGQGR